MIVFVEGPDGSGKSTLISHLAPLLAGSGRTVHVADPLWTYMPMIRAPSDFDPWVQSTAGEDVAVALLDAMARRVAALGVSQLGSDDIVLVDRGPKTVLCSARAHLQTGLRAPGRMTPLVKARQDLLTQHVAELAKVAQLRSIEFSVPHDPAATIRRLTVAERSSPAYLRYLRALSHEMASTRFRVPSELRLWLPMNESVRTNVQRSAAWLLD